MWGLSPSRPKPTRWLPIYAASTSAIIAYKFLTAPPMPEEAAAEARLDAAHDETESAVAS